MRLEEILKKIQEELLVKDEIKTQIENITRRIVRLTKKAIFLTHQEQFELAGEVLQEADSLVSELKRLVKDNPEFSGYGSVNVAFQEFAEAQLYLSIAKNEECKSPEEIGVPSPQYVLGLADCIGELRRRILDLIRIGRVSEAAETLKRMDEIFTELNVNTDLQILISGLRRKNDVARKIIEASRGDVTVEVRRSALEKLIKKLLNQR